jgi:hypothetical protein
MERMPRWQMVVEEAFMITGRGVPVAGAFRGTGRPGDRAVLSTSGGSAIVDRVAFEMLDHIDSEGQVRGRLALLLYGQPLDAAPPGTVIMSED